MTTPEATHGVERSQPDEQLALVESYRAGDRQAAEELVRRTYERTYAALHRLTGGDAELASDLTQESYRKAWGSLASYRGQAQFSSWLYRIAYNTFLNHVRSRGRTQSLDEGAEARIGDHRPGPEERLARAEGERRLHRAVLGLEPGIRFLVTARYWGEVPVRELAKMERVSEVAVRKRLRRALGQLRARLETESS